MNDLPSTTSRAFLLFAHGSSDPGWAEPFVRLQAAVRQRNRGQIIELAYLERMDPSFDEAVARLHAQRVRHITVAPLFLAIGGHMRRDLPVLVSEARQRTGIEFRVLPALGEVDSLIEFIAEWVLSSADQ